MPPDDSDEDSPPDGVFEVLTQFTTTDRKVLIRDVEFWASSLDALLQFYKETSVVTNEDKAAKAVACSRLAGLGYAMAEHFELAVNNVLLGQEGINWGDPEASTNPHVIACVETGERIYLGGEKHRKTLEDSVRKAAN